jgi:hypothetical protein
MRAIRTTCVTFGFTLAMAAMAGPAAASPCAEQWPFVCLFGPEAQAMQPAPPVAEMLNVLALQEQALPARRKRIAHKKPATETASVEAKTDGTEETRPAPLLQAKVEQAPMAIPELRLGPGPAFAMSMRLTPAMYEAVTPPTSACMIEQTFNQLFPLPAGAPKLAAAETSPSEPLMMVAIKTGTAAAVVAFADDVQPATTVAAAQAIQIK